MRASRLLASLPVALGLLLPPAGGQTTADLVGLTALVERLGHGNAPSGAGVLLGQVEAPSGGYAPDVQHPEFAGKAITLMSGPSAPSGHATTVGRYAYGLLGISNGVDSVHAYEASHWLGAGFLNGAGTVPPSQVAVKIFTNSWIGSAGGASNLYLRKLDFAVRMQGLVVTSGVNNGGGGLDVPLLSHLFNGIAVGRSDGSHKAGLTGPGIDGPGRMKPELVAPANATSWSTPLVAGAGALLVETARTHPRTQADPAAQLPEVIKAALMAGAHHRSGWSNGAPQSGPLRGATTTPLDPLYGADQIHVDRSHWILTGGQQLLAPEPGLALDTLHAGWAETSLVSGESRWARFQVERAKPYLSVLATWNRDLAPDFSDWVMPDLDLELWSTDAQGHPASLVGEGGVGAFSMGNVRSASLLDNVEHLYVEGLEPGEYLLELRRTTDALAEWAVAVAWELDCPEAVPYGTAKTNSLGIMPTLRPRGVPAVSADEFALVARGGIAGKTGLPVFGMGRAAVPFQGGTLLVSGPLRRMDPTVLDAAGAAEVRIPLDPGLVGMQRNYQFLFRDPEHPDGTGWGLTDAVEVHFCF
jgi:hypothetical protein